jgi:plasmid maintenance system antidote protein VapI
MSQTKLSFVSGEYDPGKLFSFLMEQKSLSSRLELAELLEVTPGTISNIKVRRLALSSKLLARIQEVSGMSITEIRDLMDDRRQTIRMANLAASEQ